MKETDLKSRIEALVREVETTHRYSMSRIYGLYNEAFETSEKPQSCASCLMRKVRELKVWLANQDKVEAVIGIEDTTDDGNEKTPLTDGAPADKMEDKPRKTTRRKQKNASEKN